MGQIGIRGANKPQKICAETITSTPTRLNAFLVGDFVELVWDDNTKQQLKFSIERSIDNKPFTVLSSNYKFDRNYGQLVRSSDSDIINGHSYNYRVRAYEGKHYSGYSNIAIVNTNLIAPDNLIAITITDTKIRLVWKPSPSASGYQIERTNDEGILHQIATTPNAEFEDQQLKAITPYGYRIRAYRGSKTVSRYSNEIVVYTAPSPPKHLFVKPVSKTQVDLAWFGKDGDDGYKIERKTGIDGIWKEINCMVVKQQQYSDTTCATKTKYFYRVRSYKGTLFSNYSSENICITP